MRTWPKASKFIFTLFVRNNRTRKFEFLKTAFAHSNTSFDLYPYSTALNIM